MKDELISKAVERRLTELCNQRVAQLKPLSFDDMREFVSSVHKHLLNKSPLQLKNSFLAFNPPINWMDSETDCLSSLRLLSTEASIPLRQGTQPSVPAFLRELEEARDEPGRRFRLLIERYSCPLNFALSAEDEAREYVLKRLMVSDRARIENESIAAADSDDLLLKLNLVAICAGATRDLRFLDALNYYYELLPATWHPQSRHGWLLASNLALYARALVVWL